MDKVREFVLSDTHFGHSSIIEYCQRPFATIEEHDATIIKNINSIVRKHDKLWFLGDFSLKSNQEYLKDIVNRLECKRLYLILGNHDNRQGDWHKRYTNIGFEWVSKYPIIFRNFFILSHEPLFLATERRKEGIINGKGLEVSNAPFFHCIHGHIHQLEYTDKKHYTNVSVEKTDYKPIDLNELCDRIIAEYNEQ